MSPSHARVQDIPDVRMCQDMAWTPPGHNPFSQSDSCARIVYCLLLLLRCRFAEQQG